MSFPVATKHFFFTPSQQEKYVLVRDTKNRYIF